MTNAQEPVKRHISDALEEGIYHQDEEACADFQIKGSGSVLRQAARLIRHCEERIEELEAKLAATKAELDAVMKADINTIHAEAIESCARKVEMLELTVPFDLKKKQAKWFIVGRDRTRQMLAAFLRMDAAMKLHGRMEINK